MPPLALAAGTVSLLVLTACIGPGREGRAQASPGVAPAETGRRRGTLVGRAVLAVLLGVALTAGLVGADSANTTVAPALLVGAGWPLVIVGRAVTGRTGGGGLDRGEPPHPATGAGPPADVHPAAMTALLVVWYLVVQPDRLRPRVAAAFLVTYVVVNLVGCMAGGGRTWLRRGEVLGLFLTWLGGLRGGGLARWAPPAGASIVLGILAGGFAFGLWRSADPWVLLVQRQPAAGVGTFVAAVAGGAALLWIGGRRAARRGDGGIVAAAAVPLVAGLALAHAVDRGFLTAVQLLPRLLSDPLGQGWTLVDLDAVRQLPLAVGSMTRLVITLLCVVAGGLAAAVVVRARAGRDEGRALGAISGVGIVLVVAVLAVANQSARTWG